VVAAPVGNQGFLRVRGLVLAGVRDVDGGRHTVESGEMHVHYAEAHPRSAGAQISNQSLRGPTRLDEDLVLNGSTSGPVTVAAGTFLQVNGSSSGDLTIETAAQVIIHGTVTGGIDNRGRVDVYGQGARPNP
jgi:hypothetical protein